MLVHGSPKSLGFLRNSLLDVTVLGSTSLLHFIKLLSHQKQSVHTAFFLKTQVNGQLSPLFRRHRVPEGNMEASMESSASVAFPVLGFQDALPLFDDIRVRRERRRKDVSQTEELSIGCLNWHNEVASSVITGKGSQISAPFQVLRCNCWPEPKKRLLQGHL